MTKPCPDSAAIAAGASSPVTSGTGTWLGALATVSAMVEPASIRPPLLGFCERTVPGSLSDSLSVRVTLNPAACRFDCASSKLLPTTSGTATCGLPLETTSVTDEPLSTFWPSGGLTEITLPWATVSEFSSRSEACRPPSTIARGRGDGQADDLRDRHLLGDRTDRQRHGRALLGLRPPVGSCPMTWPAGCSAVF
jgi:hypothetical protein